MCNIKKPIDDVGFMEVKRRNIKLKMYFAPHLKWLSEDAVFYRFGINF